MTTRLPGFRQVFRQLVLLGLRGAGTAAKLALTLYMVRYLGLADVGFYGLLSGAATAMPALLGFGLTPWIMRHLVNLPAPQAIPVMFTRLSFSLAMQLTVQPLAWLVDVLLGEPIPLHLAPMIAAILLLDSLASEVNGMLVALRSIRLAEMVLFIRTGLWPAPVVIYGLIEPAGRTIEVVLYGWIAGLVFAWLIIAAQLLPQQRWRHMRLQWRWLFDAGRESLPLYLNDINVASSLYLDRFLISLFLGLEMTGVYTFFWSVANMVHSLSVFGVVVPQIAMLVDAGKRAGAEFTRVVRRLQTETALWAGLLTGSAAVAVIILLPYLDRPLLNANLQAFWIVMAASLFRIFADGYGYVLYAQKRDEAIAATSVAGTATSVALNLLLVPFAGVRGAAIAFLLTAIAQLGLRYQLTRAAPGRAMAARTTL